MTTTAGAARSAAFTRGAMSSSVPVIVRAASVVPALITATGVVGARPCATRVRAMRGRFASPISTTMVSTEVARLAQSTPAPSSHSWPVTTANDEATPRWVKGMPADAGTATAEVTPGTTS